MIHTLQNRAMLMTQGSIREKIIYPMHQPQKIYIQDRHLRNRYFHNHYFGNIQMTPSLLLRLQSGILQSPIRFGSFSHRRWVAVAFTLSPSAKSPSAKESVTQELESLLPSRVQLELVQTERKVHLGCKQTLRYSSLPKQLSAFLQMKIP